MQVLFQSERVGEVFPPKLGQKTLQGCLQAGWEGWEVFFNTPEECAFSFQHPGCKGVLFLFNTLGARVCFFFSTPWVQGCAFSFQHPGTQGVEKTTLSLSALSGGHSSCPRGNPLSQTGITPAFSSTFLQHYFFPEKKKKIWQERKLRKMQVLFQSERVGEFFPSFPVFLRKMKISFP